MNSASENPRGGTTPASSSGSIPNPIDDTLRLIAHVPVPDGIEDRVHAVLSLAPRHTQILAWPAALDAPAYWAGGWMRAAAAAAIVFVVAGGGWGVYTHVERPGARAVTIPAAQPATGGAFSSAGAMRTPDTVKGPMVVQPAAAPHKATARRKMSPRPAAPGAVHPADAPVKPAAATSAAPEK